MVKYNKVVLVLLCLSNFLRAQPIFDTKKIKDLYPKDNGVMLTDEVSVNIDLIKGKPVIKADYFRQILVLDDKIPSFNSGAVSIIKGFYQVDNLEACTYVPDNKSFKKIKVKDFKDNQQMRADIFYDDLVLREFLFSGVQNGAVTEEKYTYSIVNPNFIPPHYFSSVIPVHQSIYTVTVPKSVTIKYKLFGDTTQVRLTIKEQKNSTTYTWKAEGVNKISYEDDALPRNYYEPHIFVYIASYQENNQTKLMLSDVNQLYKLNYGFIKDVNKTEPNTELVKVVDSLKVKTSDEATIKNIFYWIQDNIKYIAFEDGLGGHVPRNANDIFKKKYGDCKDMASITTYMLSQAGIKSYLTWIGTRDLPYRHEDIPLPMVDNHMIAAVYRNNRWIFLDCTAQHLHYGLPSHAIQGKDALISISPDSFVVVKVDVPDYFKNYSYDSLNIRIEDEKIKGTGHLTLGGYNKDLLVANLGYVGLENIEDRFKKTLVKGNNKCLISQIKLNDFWHRDSVLKVSYNVVIADYIRSIDNDIYVNLNLSKLMDGEMVDTLNRKGDKKMPYKYIDKIVVNLKVPAGYKIKKIPKNVNYKTNNFGYSNDYTLLKDRVILRSQFFFNDLVLYKKQFKEWNEALKNLIKSYNDLVVISKN